MRRTVTIHEKLASGAVKVVTEERDENNEYVPGTRHIKFVVGAQKGPVTPQKHGNLQQV